MKSLAGDYGNASVSCHLMSARFDVMTEVVWKVPEVARNVEMRLRLGEAKGGGAFRLGAWTRGT